MTFIIWLNLINGLLKLFISSWELILKFKQSNRKEHPKHENKQPAPHFGASLTLSDGSNNKERKHIS